MKFCGFIKVCANLLFRIKYNDLDHSITYVDLDHFIRMQLPFSLDCISPSDLNLLNQIPLALYLGAEMLTLMLILFLLFFLLLQPLFGLFENARMWPRLKGRLSVLLKLLATAAIWSRFVKLLGATGYGLLIVDCQVWQLQIFVEGSTKRKSFWWGASFVRQFVKTFPLYLWKAWWLYLYLWVALGFVAFHMECKHQAAALLCCVCNFINSGFIKSLGEFSLMLVN